MQKMIVANWKMHKTIEEARCFVEEVIPLAQKLGVKACIAPPFTALRAVAELAQQTPLVIGAQNIDYHPEGPYTGEISARMAKDAGADFVILGHSERRRYFGETSQVINLKIKAALAEGLTPLVCIGESLEQKEKGETQKRLKEQLLVALQGVSTEHPNGFIFAYEPVWAIGTKVAAKREEIEKIHTFCREILSAFWGPVVAEHLPILYGGSVEADNALDFLECKEIDGLLVGGASLAVNSFCNILRLGVNQR